MNSFHLHFRLPLAPRLSEIEMVCTGYAIHDGAIQLNDAVVYPQGNPSYPTPIVIISLTHYGFVEVRNATR